MDGWILAALCNGVIGARFCLVLDSRSMQVPFASSSLLLLLRGIGDSMVLIRCTLTCGWVKGRGRCCASRGRDEETKQSKTSAREADTRD
jgi:hypothetical protein